MTTLSSLFFAAASAAPDKTALSCEGETLSYAALAQRAARLSHGLAEAGVRTGDHIGVLLPNSADAVALMLAAADIGAAIVPLNPTAPPDAVARAFAAADVAHVVAEPQAARALQAGADAVPSGVFAVAGEDPLPTGAISLAALIAAAPADAQPRDAADPDAPYILTATSGSTGAPKPIVLSQTTKIARARAAAELYGVTAADRVLAATPLHHSLAQRLVLLPLILGATAIVMARYSPSAWIRAVESEGVSFTIAVSSQLAGILEALENDATAETKRCPSLRCIVSSSALLETAVKEKLRTRLSCDLHECYGASEIAIATNLDARRPDAPLASVGAPAPGVEVRILDETGAPLPPGETGEIAARTPMAFVGYHKQPELTAAAHADGFFKTGDLGFLDEAGWLYFRGRKKELIITGGANVYPSDVEAAVEDLAGVAECAAFALPDERLGEAVALAVVRAEGTQISARDIRLACADRLADEQQPRKIFFINTLPRNAMGKLIRRELPGLVESTSMT
ncbi:MAG: class I adenylate-forming enzyme family protein [Maricaulaceae bacterium]|jgi:long-chain acyl-CoA synthetase